MPDLARGMRRVSAPPVAATCSIAGGRSNDGPSGCILEHYNKLAQQGKCDEAPDPLTRDAHRLSVFRRVALTGK